jgi:hypothetical protein
MIIIKYILNMNNKAFVFVSIYWILLSMSYLFLFEGFDLHDLQDSSYHYNSYYTHEEFALLLALFPIVFVYIGRVFYKLYKR